MTATALPLSPLGLLRFPVRLRRDLSKRLRRYAAQRSWKLLAWAMGFGQTLHVLTVEDVLAVPATGGYFVDDQAAIKAGAVRDGLAYVSPPVTPGFETVRSASQAVSVLLILSDGYVAHGDCVSVQYSGVGGREPHLHAETLAALISRDVAPRLRGRPVGVFRDDVTVCDGLGVAAAYGVSQALLDASAHAAGLTMAETVQSQWGLRGPLVPVAIYAQTGEQRYDHVDTMVLKQVDSLPHGLINNPALVGTDGAALVAYVRWVRERVEKLRTDPNYAPILHFDVYGLIGAACDGDAARVTDVLAAMAEAAAPLALRVEHPIDAGSRDGQIVAMGELRAVVAARGIQVRLVADEWANSLDDIRSFNRAQATDVMQIKAPDLGSVANTVEAVLDCRAHGVVAHLGGSCSETDRSAQVSVHLALGARADQMLAKPGMGVNEGLAIVRNEMARTLALSRRRAPLSKKS